MDDNVSGVYPRRRQVGHVFWHREQRYEVSGFVPYLTRDGRAIELMEYTSLCAECGQPFTVRTLDREKVEPNRRCQEHKKPLVSAGGPRKSRGRKSRRVAGDAAGASRRARTQEKPAELTAQQEAAVMSAIAKGLPGGERHSARPQDKARWVGTLVMQEAGCSALQARLAIERLVAQRRVEVRDYRSAVQRKNRQGLFIPTAGSVFD